MYITEQINELLDTIERAIETFNINISTSGNELIQFSERVIKQIINYQLFKSITHGIIYLLVLIISIIYLKKNNLLGFKKIRDFIFFIDKDVEVTKETSRKQVIAFISITLAIMSTVMFISTVIDIFMCIVFPEIVVINYFKY